ncbi:MAG: hypothetical protein HY900_35965, partial [Deltaproteobacteria bacterium]|nr:hypothetical protein [Deltaproteobacteria bacterium]
MAGFRLPGVLCVITNSSPMDAGTLPRATFASPGPVGAAASPRLSTGDLDFIQATEGKNIDGSTKPLQELEQLRHTHLIRKQEASREFGARSSHVLFEQTVIDRLTVLIDRAQSPLGKATEQLAALIQQAEQPGSLVPEEKLSEAIATILGLERQRQVMGGSDADSRGSDAMALVVRALDVSTERRLSA